MITLSEHLEGLLELRIEELLTTSKKKRDRSEIQEHLARMTSIMNQLSEEDREWLDCQLVDMDCLKEDDGKTLYMAGFCDSLKMIKRTSRGRMPSNT